MLINYKFMSAIIYFQETTVGPYLSKLENNILSLLSILDNQQKELDELKQKLNNTNLE